MSKLRVLVISHKDAFRGPLTATALGIRLGLENGVVVESAGCDRYARGGPPSISAVTIANDRMERNLLGHRSRYFGDLDLGSYDRVLCVDHPSFEEVLVHHPPSRVGVELLNCNYGGIMDPASTPHEPRIYDRCFEIIHAVVEHLARSAPYSQIAAN